MWPRGFASSTYVYFIHHNEYTLGILDLWLMDMLNHDLLRPSVQ